MNRPQRSTSFGLCEPSRRPSSSLYRQSSGVKGRATPLLKSTKRIPLSAAKTNQRESYIGTANHHTMKDPRSLSDKSHMKRCIVDIVQLLSTLNYPNAVSPKMFSPPSNKDYQRVFEFLTLQVMGSFRIIGKPDEELLRVLKDLGYPYNISKSTLSNVGAMSSWPQALGALTWIADVVKYSHGCYDAAEETLALDQRIKLKQEYCKQTYHEFMTGKDGPYDEIDTELKRTLEEFDADAHKRYEELLAANAKLKSECDAKVKEKEAYAQLGEEIARKKGDIVKLQQYLSQCDDYIEKMKEKTKEAQLLTANKKKDIESATSELFQLKSKINQQELGPDDVKQLSLEKQRLKDAAVAASDRVKQLSESKWELEVQAGKLGLQRDMFVNDFNDAMKKLLDLLPYVKESLPSNIKEALQQGSYSLVLGHKGSELNQGHIINKIQPFLSSLNTELFEILGKTESRQYQLTKQINQNDDIMTDLNGKKEVFEQQLTKLANEEESIKEEFRKMGDAVKAELEEAEMTLQNARIVQDESVDEIAAKLEDAKANTTGLKRKCENERSEYKEDIGRLATRVKKFQLYTHDLLSRHDEALDATDKALLDQLDACTSGQVVGPESSGGETDLDVVVPHK